MPGISRDIVKNLKIPERGGVGVKKSMSSTPPVYFFSDLEQPIIT